MKKWGYEYIIIIAVALILAILKPFSTMGPDAQLYYGLGQNLLSGTGYVDTIRNDEILPTIGYPLLIAISLFSGLDNGLIFGKLMIFSTLLLTYLTCKQLKFTFPASVAILTILCIILPKSDIWGVEPALAFSLSFICYSIILFYNNQTMLNIVLIAIAVLISLLLRPLLLPLLLLLLIPAIFIAIRYSNFRYKIITFYVIIFAIFGGVGLISTKIYLDSRMITGTYSGVPLYCAFNKYIPLTGTYYSGLWNKLPDDIKKEAIAPLQLSNGWKARDKALKQASVQFILSYPVKATEGYIWRLARYSIAAISIPYLIVFYIWLILWIIFIKKIFFSSIIPIKQKILIGTFYLIPVYLIALQSLFIYAGERYYVFPLVFLFFSILYSFYIFNQHGQIKKINILFKN